MPAEDKVISLESYAAVIAGLGAGLELQRALLHADVPPFEWDRAAEHWRAQIDESAASDLALLVAFDAALLSAKRRFEPTVEPIESDVRAFAHFRRHFATAVQPVAFLAQRGLSLLTYARIEADWANRALSDEGLAAALKKHSEAPLEQCPTVVLTPSPLLVPRGAGRAQNPPAQAPERALPAEERRLEFVPPMAPLMNKEAAAPPPPLVMRAAEVVMTPADVEEFGAITLSFTEGPPRRNPLPFDPTAAPTPMPPPGNRILSETINTDDPLAMTMMVTTSPVPRDATPFQRQKPSPSPRGAAGKDSTLRTPSLEDTLPPTSGISAPALPFDVSPSETPTLPLERYASLCVEYAAAPARAREIAARYAITREQWAEVDAYWRGRIASEPEVRAAWEKACATYREWLSRK